jgi:hypothetical protein
VAAAQAWFRLAAAQPDDSVASLAKAGLKSLEVAMTPEVMQRANALEEEFKRSL